MPKAILAIFLIGGTAAWGQPQSGTSGGGPTVDRAAAYYHYTMAVMYAELAAASNGNSREYVDKAIENYKAAIKADPSTKELLDIYSKWSRPLLVIRPPLPAADGSRQH